MALPAESLESSAPSQKTVALPGILPNGYKLTSVLDAVREGAQSSSDGHFSTTTFEATGPDSQGRVVVRFFPSSLSRDPVRMQALRGSLQAALRLRHPNIVPIMGSGLVAGRPYIVMPYVPAGSLEDRFNLGAVSGLDAIRSIGEVAGALEYVHSRGMVHGRLKPSKLLFDESGTIQVTGFGEVVSDRVHSPSQPNGTEALYEAPEVRAGGPATRAADQYAFALIALEMLTGRPGEEARQVLKATTEAGKLDRSARPIRARFNLAPAAALVLSQALAADPAQRFSSIGAVNRALRVALGVDAPPQPVAKTPPAMEPVRRPPRRVRLSILAPAMALAICLLVGVPLGLSGKFGAGKLGIFGVSSSDAQAAARAALADGDQVASPGEGSMASQESGQTASGQSATAVSSDSSAPSGPALSPTQVSRAEPTPTSAQVASDSPEGTGDGPAPGPTNPPAAPTDPPPPPATEAPATHGNPKSCKDDPTHPNYCPPTSVP